MPKLFLILVVLCSPYFVLTNCGPTLAADGGRYNVLFIISDDLRTELACYGGMAKTPNLDALAASGVRFERAYCQFPLCNPSRTSMLTGRYPLTTGVLGNRTWYGHEHPEFVSLPKYFREHGYVTLLAARYFTAGWMIRMRGPRGRKAHVRDAQFCGRSEPKNLPQDEAEIDRGRRLRKSSRATAG